MGDLIDVCLLEYTDNFIFQMFINVLTEREQPGFQRENCTIPSY